MKAVILAGGKGTRLKPYTTVIPKPLVPIGERAIIDILITQLAKCGVDDITICLNHFAEIIKAYLGDGSKFNLKIDYSLEKEPLGTVAPIKLISDLPEDFLVMNGDLLTDLDFKKLFDKHLYMNSLLTISSYQRSTQIDFGVLELDQVNNKLTSFREKPKYSFNVSMGVYAMNRKVLDYIPVNTPFGFDNLLLALLQKKVPVNIYQYKGYWLDIGRPEDYEKANEDLDKLLSIL